MKRVTLKDIAARAGVSVALVSNYLNHHPSARMTEQTREKIDQALKELDYHCSDIARSLRTGRSRIIGYFSENLRNEVNQNEMMEIFDAAAAENYRVIVGFTGELKFSLENIRSFLARGCDALIISGFLNQKETDELAKLHIPVVILNTHPSTQFPGKMLRYDYRTAMNRAICYLQENGHTGIYYLAPVFTVNDQRTIEFLSHFPEDHVWNVKRYPEPEQMKEFLKKHPDCTAMLHVNDYFALRTIQNCAALGIRVPEDIAIIGFDNIRAAEFSTPALSTICRPLRQAARSAVRAVIAALEGEQDGLPEILPCEFIPRNSAFMQKL
jgi:DNA-binding LacI/PurR family transcriptional regulator